VVLRREAPPSPPPVLTWHELECGAYEADLYIWKELADTERRVSGGGSVIDVGAGSGRVALHLARSGHPVVALDREPELLAALARAGAGLPVETVCADARNFELPSREHPLCLMPMQTIQLLAGREDRLAFMRQAHAHLRDDGLLAIAIVTEVDTYDCRRGDHGPSPEVGRRGGVRYMSHALRIAREDGAIVIERERTMSPGGLEIDVVRLAEVSPPLLHGEGREAGFVAEQTVAVSETFEHAGSQVVMLRRA
jgi:SAM-dependent methyltransferase